MQMLSARRIKQIVAVAIVLPTVALVTVIVLRQMRAAPPESVSRTSSPTIDMTMQKLRFSEMGDTAKLWELVAERADYDKEPGLVQLTAVRLETFDDKTGGVVITSKTGSYQETKRLVTLVGSVRAVTRKGMVVNTERLEYRPANGTLITDRPVSVVDGRLKLTARGMEGSLKDEKVHFLHQVNAVIEGRYAKR